MTPADYTLVFANLLSLGMAVGSLVYASKIRGRQILDTKRIEHLETCELVSADRHDNNEARLMCVEDTLTRIEQVEYARRKGLKTHSPWREDGTRPS